MQELLYGNKAHQLTIQDCRKGGSICSERKSWARRLYWLKRKGLTDETCRLLHEIMTEPESSTFDILLFIKRIEKECNNTDQKIRLINAYIQWHKIQHGEKLHNTNLNVDIDSSVDEVIRRIETFQKSEMDIRNRK